MKKPRQILMLRTERTLMWLQAAASVVRLELVVDTNWYLLIWVKIFNNFTDPMSWPCCFLCPSILAKRKIHWCRSRPRRGVSRDSMSLWKFGQIVGKLKSFGCNEIGNKRKEINKFQYICNYENYTVSQF